MILELLLSGQGLTARAAAAAVRIGRWALDHPARVREWRKTSEACGLTDVRAARAGATRRLGPLRGTHRGGGRRVARLPCREWIAERQLAVAYEGERTDAAVQGVVRAARYLVATEDPAADAAATLALALADDARGRVALDPEDSLSPDGAP